jgi:hypothetical protein
MYMSILNSIYFKRRVAMHACMHTLSLLVLAITLAVLVVVSKGSSNGELTVTHIYIYCKGVSPCMRAQGVFAASKSVVLQATPVAAVGMSVVVAIDSDVSTYTQECYLHWYCK